MNPQSCRHLQITQIRQSSKRWLSNPQIPALISLTCNRQEEFIKYLLWLPESQAHPLGRTNVAGAIQSHHRSGSHGILQCQTAGKDGRGMSSHHFLLNEWNPQKSTVASECLFQKSRPNRLHPLKGINIKGMNCFLTFWDTIRKVSMSPSFSTSVTLMLWPWTLRVDSPSLTSSWDENKMWKTISSMQKLMGAKLHSPNTACVDTVWHKKPITWSSRGCQKDHFK